MSEALKGHGVVGAVFRVLYYAVSDHGGGESNMRRLLKEPDLVTRLAKILIGPIWDIIDGEPFELDVDWDTPLSELGDEGVHVHQNLHPEEYKEERDELRPCRYSLRYVGSFDPYEIWEAEHRDDLTAGSTHVVSATFRELVAFATSGLDYGSHEIVSLGSWKLGRGTGHDNDVVFPRLLFRDGKGDISWTTAEMQKDDVVRNTYGTYFNLVRVYSP